MTRIVLVDDHEFLRSGVQSVLDGLKMQVVASESNGADGLAAIEREDPDLVIMDLRMPEMDGIEALQNIRANGDTRPVILLTAELADDALLAALKARVDGIVLKHEAQNRLQAAIAQILSGSRYIDVELMDRAVTLASNGGGETPFDELSERELRIVEAAASGKRNKEIAYMIGSTEGAVKLYLHKIFLKLGVKTRTELAILVMSRSGGASGAQASK